MAACSEFRQDMPPSGGYKPIDYKRVPARSYFSGWALFGGYIGMTTVAAYLYYLNCKSVRVTDLEMRSASLAIYPMLLAERDREYLKQLRRNRDEESKLMANVEGWKTGTWYGEPLYHTKPKDTLNNPLFAEYYVHTKYSEISKRSSIGLLS